MARPAILPAGLLAEVAPVSSSATQLLPVTEALAPLLPGRGLQRGTVLHVETGSGHDGATTLAVALLAAASSAGSWCLALGFPDPGVLAIRELGMDLDRLAIVPRPGHHWARVLATALDGIDLLLLRLPFSARPQMARKLTARTRERRAVLIVLAPKKAWPEGPDLLFRVDDPSWSGVGRGHGHLSTRHATVTVIGRRGATRPLRRRVWLPGPGGAVVSDLALGPAHWG
jgi:hypothetical protein